MISTCRDLRSGISYRFQLSGCFLQRSNEIFLTQMLYSASSYLLHVSGLENLTTNRVLAPNRRMYCFSNFCCNSVALKDIMRYNLYYIKFENYAWIIVMKRTLLWENRRRASCIMTELTYFKIYAKNIVKCIVK